MANKRAFDLQPVDQTAPANYRDHSVSIDKTGQTEAEEIKVGDLMDKTESQVLNGSGLAAKFAALKAAVNTWTGANTWSAASTFNGLVNFFSAVTIKYDTTLNVETGADITRQDDAATDNSLPRKSQVETAISGAITALKAAGNTWSGFNNFDAASYFYAFAEFNSDVDFWGQIEIYADAIFGGGSIFSIQNGSKINVLTGADITREQAGMSENSLVRNKEFNTTKDAVENLEAEVIRTEQKDALFIADSDGNVLASFTVDGLNIKSVNIKDSNGATLGVFDKSTVDKLFNLVSGKDDEFFIVDENFNIAFRYDADGLDAAKVSDHIKSLLNVANLNDEYDATGAFYIVDSSNNIAFRYDADGLDVAKISDHFKSLLTHSHEIADVNGLSAALALKLEDAPTDSGVYGRRNGGWFEIITDSITLENIVDLAAHKDKFVVTDNDGKIGLKYDADGLDVAKFSDNFKTMLNAAVIHPAGSYIGDFKADINLGLFYGQSLSPGPNLTSPLDFKNAVAFVGGTSITRPDDTNINDEAFNLTLFGDFEALPTTGAASNTKVCAKVVNDLIEAENKKDLSVFSNSYLAYCAGVSGGQWYQLNKQNVTIDVNNWATVTDFGVVLEKGRAYVHLLHSVYFAKIRANNQGKTFNVPYLAYIQGEASDDKTDTVTEYYDKLVELFTDLNTDIKAITGQDNDVHFITYQNASFGTALDPLHANYGLYMEGVPTAHVKMSLDYDNVSLGAVLYPFLHANDLHLDESGYIRMSSLMGFVAKRATIDNNKQTTFGVDAVSVFNDGVNYYVSLKLNVPSKPIVFDAVNTVHGQQTNQGFEILNGSSVDIITGVRISNDNTVVLTCSEDPAGFDLTYAKTGNYGGGNLRDSNGDYFSFQYNGTTYRGDNWLPFFRLTIV